MDRSDTTTRRRPWPARLGALALGVGVLALGACQLDVENPTNIEDADLDDIRAIEAMEAGVAGDFAYATVQPGGGGVYNAGAMLTDELVHVGTWVGLRGLSDGRSQDDWVESQSRWAAPSTARWTAEEAIDRIGELVDDPSTNSSIAHVTMWAGHANRVLGDTFCDAVINGEAMEDHTAFYDRAIGHFQDAISIAEVAGESDYELSARGGLAHTHMMLGNWDEATAQAAMIDTDFRFEQVHRDGGREENNFRWWGHDRDETSVWGTPFEAWGLDTEGDGEGDPRVPYYVAMTEEGEVRRGGDNRRPFYPQVKFDSYGDNIAVVKGTEMRLIEAEAALVQDNDVDAAVAAINEVRNFHDLDEVDAADEAEAWELLMKERGLELWLEGKRLPDFRRWAQVPGEIPFDVVRERRDDGTDAERNVLETDVMDRRGDICVEVSQDEKRSNSNIG